MRTLLFLHIILSFCLCQSIQLSIDKNRIQKGETITLSIEVIGSDNFPLVNIDTIKSSFEILSGPSQMTNIQWVNGKMSSTKTLKWTISPLWVGKLNIPSIEGTLNGKSFKSEPLSIFVGKVKKDENQIFIKAEIDKEEAYIGEQITLTFNLYKNVNASIEPFRMPEFPGFWLENIFTPQRLKYQKKILDGVSYEVANLGQKALFPMTYNKHVLPSLKIKTNVEIRKKNKRSRDPFFDPFFDSFYKETKTKILRTDQIKIKIKDLPIPIPKNFTGAIGQFKIENRIDSDTVKINEGFIYTITLSGTGNIGMFSLPKIKFPNQIEQHKPERKFEKDIFRNELTGVQTWEYAMIPRAIGAMEIPLIEMSYFDPVNEKWFLLETKTIQIDVIGDRDVQPINIAQKKENIEYLDNDIRFITEKMKFLIKKEYSLFALSLYGYLISLLLLIWPKITKKVFGYKISTFKNRRSKKALKLSFQLLKDKDKDPFEASSNAFYTYLSHKFNLNTSQLDSSSIKVILEGKISKIMLGKAIELIKLCDTGKYGVGHLKGGENILEEMGQLIKEIDKKNI